MLEPEALLVNLEFPQFGLTFGFNTLTRGCFDCPRLGTDFPFGGTELCEFQFVCCFQLLTLRLGLSRF